PPPVLVVVSPTGNHTIGEIYGITPSVADRLYDLADVADGWFSGDEAREILINPSTAEELGVSVGDEVCVYRSYRGVTYRVGNFTVCGLYDPRKASEVRGLDGSRLLDVHAPHVDIIATSRAAVSLGAETTRYTMVLKEGYDALEISSYFGLVYKFFGVTVKSGVVYGPSIPKANIAMAGVESYLVPLLLASLMIFSFAFGTVYERRGEIATLTSVGLNPSNIRNVILTEGFVAATIGGLSGSFVGIYLYPLAGFFFDLPGYVKSGPFYFLLTLGLIMFMALLGGYLPSRKAGMMTTPSIMRRWSLKKMGRKAGRAVQMKLPVTVLEEEYPRFEEYLQTHVQTEALEAGVRVKLDHVKKSDSANTYDFKVWSLSRTGLPAALCTLEATESDRKFSILLKVKARPYRREIVDAFRMVLLKYTEWGKKVRQPV
ncbi:MAG: FtsX-like permease family protein, partial [Nitrososphaeria archaeon]|nr:FtsX-like permease family protein [Nitrososphaeria archaeon]